MKDKILAILLILNNTLFIISLTISFVLLFRPFYYFHIDYLNIPEESGYTKKEIKDSYDNVIDYLTFTDKLETGRLKYSSEGYDHFKDCKLLFKINFIILGITSLIIIFKKIYFKNIKFFKYSINFCSSIINIAFLLIILILSIIIGFNKSFKLFHNIFFLGKDNWLLNSKTDEIIKILPQKYFMNCAILVISIIILYSLVIIIKNIHQKD